MNAIELREWLEAHDEIMSFTDFESTFDDDEEFSTTMQYWFNNPEWNDGKYTFVHVGIDGMGSQFAVWKRPDSDVMPVVYFGSEGGRGVLTKSPEGFALALSYGIGIDEYDYSNDMEGPAKISAGNWMLDEAVDGDLEDGEDDPQALLARYQSTTAKKFGKIPPLEELIGELEELNKEFMTWVESRVSID